MVWVQYISLNSLKRLSAFNYWSLDCFENFFAWTYTLYCVSKLNFNTQKYLLTWLETKEQSISWLSYASVNIIARLNIQGRMKCSLNYKVGWNSSAQMCIRIKIFSKSIITVMLIAEATIIKSYKIYAKIKTFSCNLHYWIKWRILKYFRVLLIVPSFCKNYLISR